MLSSLSRGYGSWTGNIETYMPLPEQESEESQSLEHRHGITVSPRSKSGRHVVQVTEDGRLEIPKTFATRKGALMLFTAPDDLPKAVQPSSRSTRTRKRQRQKDVMGLSLKLKTLDRLSLSVLQYGEKLYDKDTASITDKENKMILNFLHDLNSQDDDTDLHSQPGGDLKFYLRDLKRRASCRGYGTGDTTTHRTRSVELQELLDELEQTWPKYGGRPRRESTFTTCQSDDYFHPSSPTPSVTSTRSFSRSKVLSSYKLAASLKSLNQFGRPSSAMEFAEPDTRSVMSDTPLITGISNHYGRFHRSKSTMWVSEMSNPAVYHQHIPTRPDTSHSSKSHQMRKMQVERRKLVTTPDHSEENSRKQQVWVDVESQPDAMSFMSEDVDGRSSCMSVPESEVRGVDRTGRAVTPVRGERVLTPSSRGGDRDAMLMEAASVLSSLVEEENLDIPVDDVTDVEEEKEDILWPGEIVQEEGRRSVTSSRSKTPMSQNGERPLVQPLQPPYSGLMKGKNEETVITDEEKHKDTQKDTLIEMRDASTEPEDIDALTDERSQSQMSTVRTPVPRINTPAGLSEHSDQMIQQVSDMITSSETGRPTSGHSSAVSGDKPSADPVTLVSMMGKHGVTDSVVDMDKAPSPQQETISAKSTTPPPPTFSSPSNPKTAPTITTPSLDIKEVKNQATQPSPREEKDEVEDDIDFQRQETLSPKRRMPQEPISPRLDEQVAGEGEGEKEEEGTGLSERVKREIQERDERAARQKEEKERAEQDKRSEEERKKQAADDKRRAAEERIKAKAEEAARRKEEEELLKEQTPPEEPVETPKKSLKAKKETVSTAKSDKPEKQEDAKVISVEIDNARLEALEKLKSENKEMDLPLDKIQNFMESQKKEIVKEEENKDVEIPEHMKEMFARRSNSQVQEALEEEIDRMRVAADNVLGESLVPTVDGEEGLSAEDFEAAQEALKEKLKKAEEQMMNVVQPPSPPPKQSKTPTGSKSKSEKKRSPSRKKKAPEMSEAAKAIEAAKEQKRLEKQKRLKEVMELQKKIKEKEGVRKTKEAEAKKQAEELAERMESLRQEEEELEMAENDAREQLNAVRKVQREEREARRKQDLEKKKQNAIDRREKEKAMIDAARSKEQEMLDRIADAEMARRLREEEEAKREEEELLAQERFEAEMKDAQRLAEEEEERLRELERQAEEEAFQRLMEEKEAAEEKRWQLEIEARKMREREEQTRHEMLEEERRLEAERKQKEAEEEARREEERERLRELQRLEEEARDKMRSELDKRRVWAMKRREYNLEQRANLDAIKQSQGLTDPWTFSYYVKWPKESYHRPMGQNPKKKSGPPRPRPKPPSGQGNNPASAPSAVDGSAIPR